MTRESRVSGRLTIHIRIMLIRRIGTSQISEMYKNNQVKRK